MMKIFRGLKTTKKSIIIWALMIFAIGTMLQSGAGATAMAFNGLHYDFFDLTFDGQQTRRSADMMHFEHGVRFFGFGDDHDKRGASMSTKRVPSLGMFFHDGQLGGWDGDFDVVQVPRRPSRDRDDDTDKGPRKNFRIWDLPKWGDQGLDDQGLDDEWFDFTGEFDGCFHQSVCEGEGDGDNNPVPTPEPATLLLLGGGLLGLAGFKKKKI